MNQSRWRSKGAWTSTLLFIAFIVKNYTQLEIPNVDQLIDMILIVATAWGIFNDPHTKTKY